MILKKIKFHNFRPFIGDQTIDLSSEDKEKNVTVILGSNTFGKTTYVLSLTSSYSRWALQLSGTTPIGRSSYSILIPSSESSSSTNVTLWE